MKLVNTIILDAEGTILPLDDIECFRIYFPEVPNIGEEISLELFENSNIDEEEHAKDLSLFLENEFPDNYGRQYSFIVKKKIIFRYNTDL